MCIFGSKQQQPPAAQPIPQMAPAPTITPSEVSAQAAGESRRKRIEQLRYGFASTVKTGGKGITGSGPELASNGMSVGQAKTKLGA